MAICIFCFGRPPPGLQCTYDLHHEYLEEIQAEQKKTQQKQVAKADLNKCLKCGMHRKNPLSLTSNCEHQYPEP